MSIMTILSCQMAQRMMAILARSRRTSIDRLKQITK
jgi:hypothetical protein